MRTLSMAANWILVIIIPPKRAELSSPIRPFETLTRNIFPSFIILKISMVDLGCPTTFLIIDEDKN